MIYIRFKNGDEYRLPVNQYRLKDCAWDYIRDYYVLN